MKNKILVVDDNESLVEMLKEYFRSNSSLEVIDSAPDGLIAIDKIVEKKDSIDIILLDLIMPRKDGLYVLEELRRRNINKSIIVLTSYNEEETTRKVSEYGVKYMMLKPFDLKDLEERIISVINSKRGNDVIDFDSNNLNSRITKVLHDLGIPSHIKGYQYIREAVNLVYNDSSLIGGITKELYPKIGNKFDASTTRVERAIRHAIEVSWNRGDWELMEEIFGHSVDIDKAKPTNSEFIVTVADKLKLDNNSIKNG